MEQHFHGKVHDSNKDTKFTTTERIDPPKKKKPTFGIIVIHDDKSIKPLQTLACVTLLH